MRKIIFLATCLFCSVSFGQPPADTARTIRRGNIEYYQNKSGRTIGRSLPNISGGRTYYNNQGVSSRSNSTYNGGQKFMPNSTNKGSGNGYGSFNAPSKGKK